MTAASGRTPVKYWLLCLLLFAATTLNYLDRQTVSILAPTIQRELRLDNAALGLVFSAFYYTYTFAQFAVGMVLDRSHLRWTFGLAVVAWSLATGLTSLAGSLTSLLAFRLLLGIAESANWPAAMRIVARALPPKDRPLGNGIFTSGTSVGALIAPAMILGLAAWFGWRLAFVGVAGLGAIWFLVWLAFTRDPDFAGIWRGGKTGTARPRAGYAEVLSSPRFWRVFVITILVNPCLYFNVNWLPTYFSQQRGLQPGRELGLALTLIYLGLDFGYLACGFGVRLLARSMTVTRARQIVFTAATLLLCISAFVPAIPQRSGAIAALMVVNFAIGIWITMYLTMAQEVSDVHVSTAAGLLGGSGSLAGALAMYWVGRVTQQTGSFAAPMAGVSIAAILAAAAGYRVAAGARPSAAS
jgi:ACS family hexuronate transporter-like MFS transporter